MKNDKQNITVKAARLIIGYLHNRLSDSEKDALDGWICRSDKNMELFCQLTENVDENVFNPDQLIVETEQVIDLWIIAALIARHQKGLNNEVEKLYLEDWVKADSKNEVLFKKLQYPAFMQKMLVWNELKRQQLSNQ